MRALIARDKDGSLSIYFGKKPYKGKYAWSFYDHLSMNFADIPDKNLFPEIKWEDEEPTEVEIKIVYKQEQQTQPQTKFDPKTLKPFDRVLVRNLVSSKWRCEHFSYFNNGGPKPYMTSTSYLFCIPYNEDTKHLVGTRQEAPKFYKYWED